MVADFAALSPTFIQKENIISPCHSPANIAQAQFKSIRDFFAQWRPDLVFSNTITNGALVNVAHEHGIPVIIHVQEERTAFQTVTARFLNETLSCAHYICVSDSVKRYLLSDYQLSPEKLSMIHNGIDLARINQSLIENPMDVKAKLNIPKHAIVVGGAGMIVFRKGVDLWLQMARRVMVEAPQHHPFFLWVGAKNNEYANEMVRNVAQLGLEERVVFTGEASNPYPFMNAMDIFAMSSRQEAIGLVNLEAAYLGKPIVCFGRAGGSREIVETDAGIIVEYLDAYEMAHAVIKLISNEKLRAEMGARGRAKVLERFDIRQTAAQIRKVIQQVLESSSANQLHIAE